MTSYNHKLRIGSADDADIVIKLPTVSRYHCELLWKNHAWVLNDLGSTNGTFVDGTRITEAYRLSSSSVVTLGRGVVLAVPSPPTSDSKPEVGTTEMRGEFAGHSHATTADATRVPKYESQTPNHALLLVFGTVVVTLLVCLIAYVGLTQSNEHASPNKAERTPIVEGAKAMLPTSPPDEKVSSRPSALAGVASKTLSNNPTPLSETTTHTASMDQVEPAYWAVVVESSDGKNRKLLGTAIAISPHRLVTLASIAEAFESVKSIYSHLTLIHPNKPKLQVLPHQIQTHPANKTALAAYVDFEKRLEAKLKTVTEMKDPTLEESLEWSSQLESIMANIAKTDFATISLTEKLDSYIPLSKDATLTGTQDYVLRGYPMIVPSPNIESNLPVFYLDLPVKCVVDDSSKQSVMMAELLDRNVSRGIPVISMVCLNPKSEIIGLCVREELARNPSVPKRCQIARLEVFW